MELYILRHAIAIPRGTPGFPDDDRPLTDQGIRKMKVAARGLARILPDLDVILTSPLQRAEMTAEIVAQALDAEEKLVVTETLKPGTHPQRVLVSLSRYKAARAIMIVGHEPDVSSLAATLIGAPTTLLEFKKGALCRIDLDTMPPVAPGKLIFLVQPKHLRALATS